MFVIEYKVKAKETQYRAIDEAIRTAQFVRSSCGFTEDRDVAASMTILQKGRPTVGHTGTAISEIGNASGDIASTVAGEILSQQAESLNEEPLDS